MNYPKEWDELPANERKKKIKKFKKEEVRFSEQRRKKKYKILSVSAVSIIIALIIYTIVLAVIKDTRAIEGLSEYNVPEWKHVSTFVEYPQSPPVGGDHHPNWVSCNGDVYDKELDQERAVHALEHGAVWITYKEGEVSQEGIESLTKMVKNYTFMSPYSKQNSPIVLTAWGVQLELDDAEDPRVDYFIDKFRQGPQTPEPGATCNSNNFGM
jgi:hypothetical protein